MKSRRQKREVRRQTRPAEPKVEEKLPLPRGESWGEGEYQRASDYPRSTKSAGLQTKGLIVQTELLAGNDVFFHCLADLLSGIGRAFHCFWVGDRAVGRLDRAGHRGAGHSFRTAAGRFLNATLGNTVELFIAMMAILANRFELVKASIAGSIDSVLVGLRLTELFVGVSRSLSPATRPSKARQCSWPCATIWI